MVDTKIISEKWLLFNMWQNANLKKFQILFLQWQASQNEVNNYFKIWNIMCHENEISL